MELDATLFIEAYNKGMEDAVELLLGVDGNGNVTLNDED